MTAYITEEKLRQIVKNSLLQEKILLYSELHDGCGKIGGKNCPFWLNEVVHFRTGNLQPFKKGDVGYISGQSHTDDEKFLVIPVDPKKRKRKFGGTGYYHQHNLKRLTEDDPVYTFSEKIYDMAGKFIYHRYITAPAVPMSIIIPELRPLVVKEFCDWNDSMILDFVGVVPIAGDALDVGRGITYMQCGKYIDAFLTLIASAPVIGAAVVAFKASRKIKKIDQLYSLFAYIAKKIGWAPIKLFKFVKDRFSKFFKWVKKEWKELFETAGYVAPLSDKIDVFESWVNSTIS